ncbi:Trm112 family protein [Desulfobaculum bizertense]|uniref:UPF0434 protein SAMN02745702_00406 n=1 Tax=Desulfobaculum bizertense DSM 18034 TaxID=1121442 RepID=A0A1T4VIM4_9BACT|nr:Trm112 family protein [Desulfobaculum bizertense]UIJ37929.1 Trm112 family protein [Desulfobaculum bizertense]SKA64789.1 hypothetical protein SAMN02745702_00406 [Desulfobaculum bizertense DSM 18034]
MALNKELLEILACPKCKKSVQQTPKGEGLYCASCKVVYPIREEIPIMLVDEAVDEDLWNEDLSAMHKK